MIQSFNLSILFLINNQNEIHHNLKKDDRKAVEYLDKKLNESMDRANNKLNFAIHIVANKLNL